MKSFPFGYEDPKLCETKINYYLTISALISDCENSEKIYEIQEELLKDVKTSDVFGSGIYKCPKDRIHFSVINFKDLSRETNDRERFETDRQSKIDIIKRELVRLAKKINIIDNHVDIAYIYTCKSESIAIQAFPSKELCILFENIRNKFANMKLGDVLIKGYEHNDGWRFAINLARYYKMPDSHEFNSIKSTVQKINDESLQKEKLFSIKLKSLTFVLSDNSLANDNYEQLKMDIA